jgi:GTP-binding protein Era
MKTGFANIFGRPNAGKSTLLNMLMGEKLAIVSSKVQTTRHRIKGFFNNKSCQIILSDTPGIIDPQYRLHEKMMQAVKNALEDADVALLLVGADEDETVTDKIFESLKLKVPAVVIINKIDKVGKDRVDQLVNFFSAKSYCRKTACISALLGVGKEELINAILEFLPESEPFYNTEELTDLPTRFFVSELIREKIYELYEEEIPYHAAVVVKEFKEKTSLVKISADIIVQRETQKAIIIGGGGRMIKKLGTEARIAIEAFLQQKVFLELFVKVRQKWRDNETWLREFGYG